jgi:hypothetical protein
MSEAFKEWAVVCEALGSGRQSIILRKGGIAEGRAGFAFQHTDFFLFPTWFHEQLEKTVLDENVRMPDELPGEIEIRFAATLEWTKLVTDLPTLQSLRDFHILHESVIHERFTYDQQPGIHVALVRIFRLDPPRRLALEKRYGGCRSWVELPDLDDCALVSVISDEEHASRRAALESLLARF